MNNRSIVIIPTYNEKENITKMISYVINLTDKFNILVVDDNSPDGTSQLVEEMQKEHADRLFLIKRSGKLGLGTAYITGFDWAIAHEYSYIFEMDADFSHNPDDLIKLERALIDGEDVVVGSRYVSGVNVVNWPLGRVLMSYFASVYVRIITGMKVCDATAGFVGYKAEVLQKIISKGINMKGYGFQIEMKFKGWLLGYKIKEVPIIFTDRQEGVSKMSGGIFSEAFFGVLWMKIRSIFKYN